MDMRADMKDEATLRSDAEAFRCGKCGTRMWIERDESRSFPRPDVPPSFSPRAVDIGCPICRSRRGGLYYLERCGPYDPVEVLDVLDGVGEDLRVELTTERGASRIPEFRTSTGWRFRVEDELGYWGGLVAFAGPDDGAWTDTAGDFWREVRTWKPWDELSDDCAWPWMRDGRSPAGYDPRAEPEEFECAGCRETHEIIDFRTDLPYTRPKEPCRKWCSEVCYLDSSTH